MKAIGIILAGGNNDGRLGVLTDHRAAAALPIGSCYRAIDFTLSNMSNSGIGKVAVLTQYNSRSLRDHLGPPFTGVIPIFFRKSSGAQNTVPGFYFFRATGP